MSSKVCQWGLATNVLWKAVPVSGTCICEGPIAELGKCTRHDIVRSGRRSKTATSSCCCHSLYTASERHDRDFLLWMACISVQSLNCTRNVTASQCSWIRYGETYRKSNTSRAAFLLWTRRAALVVATWTWRALRDFLLVTAVKVLLHSHRIS